MKQATLFIFSLFFILTLVSCQSPAGNQSGVEVLSPTAFVEAYKSATDAILIDCRTPREVNAGKIDGAMNIDYTATNFSGEVEKLNKEQPVYIYCQSGGRSAAAAKQLKTLGFEEVYDLKGGYGAYLKN